MKVTQTVVATGPDGQDLGDLVKPVEMVWSKDTDELGVIHTVAAMLSTARDAKFTKTVAIHIEL